jgi:hypothetical protein
VRAGEAVKGFAVVAEEVKSLATQKENGPMTPTLIVSAWADPAQGTAADAAISSIRFENIILLL